MFINLNPNLTSPYFNKFTMKSFWLSLTDSFPMATS